MPGNCHGLLNILCMPSNRNSLDLTSEKSNDAQTNYPQICLKYHLSDNLRKTFPFQNEIPSFLKENCLIIDKFIANKYFALFFLYYFNLVNNYFGLFFIVLIFGE